MISFRANAFLFLCFLAGLCLAPAFADKKEAHIFGFPLNQGLISEIPEIILQARPVPAASAESEPALPRILPHVFANKEIMGKGETEKAVLASFLLESNDGADPEFVGELVSYYIEEAEAEGVNHDLAFAQMCLETGFLRYGGLVTGDMNNFCGLGSTGPGESGERFASPRMGVRAHIQHLKAYASVVPPKQELVDPRYRWVRKGSAKALKNLAGTWAADRQYADKISAILNKLYQFKDSSGGAVIQPLEKR